MPASVGHYRAIAVTVQARADGFRWRLLESRTDGQTWAPLSSACAPVPRYRDAMTAGLLALQAITEDLDAGPQLSVERADEQPDDEPGRGAAPRSRRGGGAFGFGGLS